MLGLAGGVALGLFGGGVILASSSGTFLWAMTVAPAARKRPLLPVWSAWWWVSMTHLTGWSLTERMRPMRSSKKAWPLFLLSTTIRPSVVTLTVTFPPAPVTM